MFSGEPLTIETPEQVALELPVAGIGSRFLALAADTVIQVLALIAAVLIMLAVAGLPAIGAFAGTWMAALVVLLVFCLYWGYFAAFEILWTGQTPGKRLAGIRVIRDSGRPADAPAILLRNLLRAIDVLPGPYGVGIVTMMLTRHSRRIGDLVAGTVVVHDRRAAPVAALGPAAAPAAPGERVTGAERVSPQELTVIEAYLGRRLELPPGVQEQTASRIVAMLQARHDLHPAAGQDADAFLETIARDARDAARFR